MEMLYCNICKKITGHKRAIGVGTLLGGVVTLGVSLAAVPFYPLRCVICGSSETSRKPYPEANKSDEIKSVNKIEEYQTWAEEFIYRFNMAVTNISNNPGNPINDYGVLVSFLDTIKEKSLDTPRIRGLENKSAFEQTLSKARNLFDELGKSPEMQNHLRQQQETRIERGRRKEQARLEKVRQQEQFRVEREQRQAVASKEKAENAAKEHERFIYKSKIFAAVSAIIILVSILLLLKK
jgi:hypothetical protein